MTAASPPLAPINRPRSAPMPRIGQIGFGVGSFGVALTYMAIGQLLFYFYTEILKLSPAQAGYTIAIATFWDAIVDPIVAWFVARTNTRLGRYRPYLIYGAAPMSAVFILMFWVPNIPFLTVATVALITHLLFRTVYQLIYMPYTGMITRLTSDADQRSDLEAWRGWFISLGILFVSFLGLPIIHWAGQGHDRIGFLWLAVIIGILSAGTILFSGAVTQEAAGSRGDDRDESSIFKALALLGRNRPFLAILAGTLFCGIAIVMVNNVAIDVFQYHLHDRNAARFALSASSIAGLAASPLWAMCSRRFGKRATWMLGSALSAAAAMTIFVLDPHSILVLSALYFFVGAGFQAYLVIQFSAAADAVDYGEWRTGERVEALLFGLMIFVNKAALAIGAALVGLLLSWAHFVPGQVQSQAAIVGLRATSYLGPAVTLALSVAALAFYPLSTSLHRRIRSELQGDTDDAAEADGAIGLNPAT